MPLTLANTRHARRNLPRRCANEGLHARAEMRVNGRHQRTNSMGSPKLRVEIRSSRDIVVARQQARELAQSMGFEGGEISIIAAAISEIAGNILDYAPSGEISLERIQQGKRQGLGI